MKLERSAIITVVALCLLIMQGCGGGGGGNTQSAPEITLQPANATVQSGQTATFTVTSAGSPAPIYQWLHNGMPINGATGSSYTTPTLTAANSGDTYSVAVSNAAGSVTSNVATVTVQSAPVITSQPTNDWSYGALIYNSRAHYSK